MTSVDNATLLAFCYSSTSLLGINFCIYIYTVRLWQHILIHLFKKSEHKNSF